MLFMYFFEAFMTFQSDLNFAENKKNKTKPKTSNKTNPKNPHKNTNLRTTNSTQNHPKTKQNSQQKLPTQQNPEKTILFTCINIVWSGIYFQSHQVSYTGIRLD